MCRLQSRITGAKALPVLVLVGIARGFVVEKARCDNSGEGGGGMVNDVAVVPFGICKVCADDFFASAADDSVTCALVSPYISRSSSCTKASSVTSSSP